MDGADRATVVPVTRQRATVYVVDDPAQAGINALGQITQKTGRAKKTPRRRGRIR